MKNQESRIKSQSLNIKCGVLFTLMFLMSIKIASAQQQAFSLKEAQDFAIKNNANNQNAEIDARIANAQKNEYRGIGLPQINGNFSLNDQLDIPTSLIPGQIFGAPAGVFIPVKFGTQYNATAGLSVSQILFSSDYIVGLKAAKGLEELSQKSITRTKVETYVAVSKAYYSTLIAKERLKLLTANIARVNKLKNDTKAMNDNGFVEKIDLSRIEVTYNNLLSDMEKTQRLIGLSEVMLKFQMGMDVASAIQLTDSLALFVNNSPTVIDGSTKANYANRPEYSLLETQQKLNELNLKRYRLSYLPSLMATGTAGRQFYNNKIDQITADVKKNWFPLSIVGVSLNVPIFAGGQKYYRVQQAQLNILKTKNSQKQLERLIDMETTSASISYQNAVVSINTQKKNMALADEVYRVSKAKYEQGVGTNLEIMTAETALTESQTNYYNALFDYLVAKVDYDKATGSIK